MAKKITKIKDLLTAEELSLSDVTGLFSGSLTSLWAKKFKILLIIIVPVILFSVVGMIAAKTSPKEYEAKVVLLTDQVASSGSGSLSSLASLAGINLPSGGSGGDLGADLYPLILSNRPFLIDFSKQPIFSADEHKFITLEEYFKRPQKTDYVSKVKAKLSNPQSWFSDATPTTNNIPFTRSSNTDSSKTIQQASFGDTAFVAELSKQDVTMIATLSRRIKLTQTGKLINLSVKMPEPRLSAEATTAVLNLLIKYVTRFKLGKQLETLRFLEARTAEAEIKYKEAQARLAGFKDNNYGVIYQTIQSRETQLSNDFSLTFGIYNQLVGQLEQARIQLKKDTPLFTVIEPVYIPEGTAPESRGIIMSYATSGFMLGLLLTVIWLALPIIRRSIKRRRTVTTVTETTESI